MVTEASATTSSTSTASLSDVDHISDSRRQRSGLLHVLRWAWLWW